MCTLAPFGGVKAKVEAGGAPKVIEVKPVWNAGLARAPGEDLDLQRDGGVLRVKRDDHPADQGPAVLGRDHQLVGVLSGHRRGGAGRDAGGRADGREQLLRGLLRGERRRLRAGAGGGRLRPPWPVRGHA